MNLPERCAVLVVTCDNYKDLWQPFFTLFKRFWSDCRLPVYLITNFEQPAFENVSVIPVGNDVSWSDNIINALAHIPQDYVFMMLEDLMLTGTINNSNVEKVFTWAIENNVNYVRMNPTVRGDVPHNELVDYVSKGTVYRASVVMPLFKKEALLQLLKNGENAWEFEYYGSERADDLDGFYATKFDYFPNRNTVIKKVWEYRSAKIIEGMGVTIDYSKRRVMNRTERFIWNLKLIRTFFFGLVPSGLRRTVKEQFVGKKPSM